MRTFGYRLVRALGSAAAVLWWLTAPACNVPVFRYALERWEADSYPIIVFHREPLTAEQQAQVETMEKAGRDHLANLAVTGIDLAREVPQPLRTLWNTLENPTSPWVVVRYPRRTGIEPPAWTGPLNAESVRAVLESPARREIVLKLLRGDAIVWLLLEGGEKRRDEEAAQLVEVESRKLEQTLRLPEASPLDPPMTSGLPLKIAFSMVRVARVDPAERMLVAMLLNWKTNRTTTTEPMLFPIFGRGRAVPPAIGDEIRAEAIRDMAEFLTGPCSCEVKEMNPGYDLLLAANWTSLPGYQEVMLPSPPLLVGMSQFAAAATNPLAPPREPGVSLAASSAAPAAAGGDRLVRNVGIVLGIGVILLGVTTVVLKVRMGRRSR
jgi:hypothetical protein